MIPDRILTNKDTKDERILRHKTKEAHPSSFSAGEKKELLETMKKTMRRAHGVGLSANQIGLPYRLFVAEVPRDDGTLKFYAIFNPQIEKLSKEQDFLEEGCLSVPGTYGEVKRSLEVTLKGIDKNGKAVKIKAWGLLAHVFQHEVDHLDGKLFIDKGRNLHEVPVGDRLKKHASKIKKDR
ncbi:MAG: peptide deformylase [Patescibacteria group bacterium]